MTAAVLRNSPSPSYSALAEDAAGAPTMSRIEIGIEARRVAEVVGDDRRPSGSRSARALRTTSSRETVGASGPPTAASRRHLASCDALMRCIDSSTATVSSRLSRFASSPVSTRPVTSLARSTFVGRTDRSISPAGAIELPPESDALRADQRQQLAVGAGAMDAVHRVVRIVAGVVLGARRNHGAVDRWLRVAGEHAVSMPRRNALSEWNASPSSRVR